MSWQQRRCGAGPSPLAASQGSLSDAADSSLRSMGMRSVGDAGPDGTNWEAPPLGAGTERSAEECREASVPGRTDAKAPQEAILMPPGWREGTAGGEAAAMSQNGSELVLCCNILTRGSGSGWMW